MQVRFTSVAANDASWGAPFRGRTVPITETITPVPGYPRKLVVFKMAASRFWQVRCWIKGKTYRRSTQSQSLRVAQSFARQFYEQLLVQTCELPALKSPELEAPSAPSSHLTFAHLASRMFSAEQARVERGEYTRGSLMVLRNRLDSHLLPRWGSQAITEIGYPEMMAFVDELSGSKSTTTISQYLIAVRKVFNHALRVGAIEQLPTFPKVKIRTASRGAFTPTEYWRILRTARSLQGQAHPGNKRALRQHYKLLYKDVGMPPDLAWAIGFMVNSFIRPSDLKTLKHRHVEVVRSKNTYLRLTLPETKRHDAPIVTLFPAVRIYRQIVKYQQTRGKAHPDDYLFLPDLKDRNYALNVLGLMFNWVLDVTGDKFNAHGQPRSMYSLRHSAITFRLLYGQGIDLLTLARNARTSVEVINNHYASTVSGEQNIALLQSRRSGK